MSNDAGKEFIRYQMLKGLAPKTAEQNLRTVAIFQRWCEVNHVAFTQDSALEYMQTERERVSAATMRARMYAIKTFFSFLGEDVKKLDNYRLPPLPQPQPHPLPTGMIGVRKMIANATGASRHLIALQGLAGLRVAEARDLTRDDIDEIRKQIVVKGKGEKLRRIPISAELWEIMDEMPKSGKLVPLSYSGARAAVTRVAKATGIEGAGGGGVSSHDLRATFATAVYGKTKDIMLVSRLLGHASVKTTQVYLGIGTEAMAEAVEL